MRQAGFFIKLINLLGLVHRQLWHSKTGFPEIFSGQKPLKCHNSTKKCLGTGLDPLDAGLQSETKTKNLIV